MRLHALALAAGMILLASCAGHPAFAAPCLPAKAALDGVRTEYGEIPAYTAANGAGVVVMTINPKDGSWSMWVMPSSAVMCLIANGKNWAAFAPPAAPEPPPAVEPQVTPLREPWRFIIFAGAH